MKFIEVRVILYKERVTPVNQPDFEEKMKALDKKKGQKHF